MNQRYVWLGVLAVLLIGGLIWWANTENGEPDTKQEITAGKKEYRSERLGIAFKYSDRYFLTERDMSAGEQNYDELVLMEDTAENRALVAGELSDGREGPPTINVAVHQNDLDRASAEQWIKNTDFSNWKLSNGNLTEWTVGGEKGFKYQATGLYENENVVIGRPDNIYMFTVFYFTRNDRMLGDFVDVLDSVEWL